MRLGGRVEGEHWQASGQAVLTPGRPMSNWAMRAEGDGSVPNVSLTPEQQRFIESRVASGRFGSASEVMRHALRLMQEAEERRERFVAMLCDVSARANHEGADSERSWTAPREEIRDHKYDLKAVNPNRKLVVDTRTPTDLLQVIEDRGQDISRAIAELRKLIAASPAA